MGDFWLGCFIYAAIAAVLAALLLVGIGAWAVVHHWGWTPITMACAGIGGLAFGGGLGARGRS